MADALVPTLASAVVLRDGEGRVLLVKENYGRRRWGLPGGAVEPAESPAEAAIREAAEETGLHVEVDDLIALYYLRTQARGLRFVFAGRIVGGELQSTPTEEIAELRWFELDAIPDHTTNTAPFALRDAAAGLRGAFRDIDATATS